MKDRSFYERRARATNDRRAQFLLFIVRERSDGGGGGLPPRPGRLLRCQIGRARTRFNPRYTTSVTKGRSYNGPRLETLSTRSNISANIAADNPRNTCRYSRMYFFPFRAPLFHRGKILGHDRNRDIIRGFCIIRKKKQNGHIVHILYMYTLRAQSEEHESNKLFRKNPRAHLFPEIIFTFFFFFSKLLFTVYFNHSHFTFISMLIDKKYSCQTT